MILSRRALIYWNLCINWIYSKKKTKEEKCHGSKPLTVPMVIFKLVPKPFMTRLAYVTQVAIDEVENPPLF